MGLFDSVRWDCPDCKAKHMVEVQSKTGPCLLKCYDPLNVPLDMAVGMVGQRAICHKCRKEYVISGDAPISMKLSIREIKT